MVRRIIRSVVAAAILLVAGCSSTHRVETTELDSGIGSGLSKKEGQRVEGYTSIDGKYHKTRDGRARFHGPDTLEIEAPTKWEPSFGAPGAPHGKLGRQLIPRDSIASLDLVHSSTVKSALGIVSLAAIAAGVIIVAECCPYLYSWDGTQYVLDGEPYGGATTKSLERTDWSRLERIAEDRGRYRVLLTNELAETQHTNSLQLMTVDHDPACDVILDRDGTPHAFRTVVPLADARDERDRDLLVWLRDDDHVVWYPNLMEYAQEDHLSDTRNHLTLTFPRPARSDRVYLVTRAATGPFGSHMIRTMLGMRGNQVDAFYAAIDHVGFLRDRLLAWNAREELFHLAVEVETASGWKRQDFIPGGGPLVSECRAIPIDLAGVPGDRVRIRIHPPIGFWSFNFFELAFDESGIDRTIVAAKTARDQDGTDVRRRLLADDKIYLDAASRDQWTEIDFPVPPRRSSNLVRTVFARTRGWYRLDLGPQGPPDAKELDRLTNEPGYAVRRELEDLKKQRALAEGSSAELTIAARATATATSK